MSRIRRRAIVCQQLVEMVTDYLEGGLRDEDRAAVQAHLADCGHCTGYVEQVRRMLDLTAATAGAPSLPASSVDDLVARFRHRTS